MLLRLVLLRSRKLPHTGADRAVTAATRVTERSSITREEQVITCDASNAGMICMEGKTPRVCVCVFDQGSHSRECVCVCE